ncbi:MAG: iron chaperone [Thermoanaerobaculales bacterium]
MPHRPAFESVDAYIASFPPDVQAILQRLRSTVREAAQEAREVISYKMPAFKLHGILLYFAAFTNHIGLYPPVSGDPGLQRALARYTGPKGNLRFPLDEPIPYRLIARIAKLRVRQDRAKARAGGSRSRQKTRAITMADDELRNNGARTTHPGPYSGVTVHARTHPRRRVRQVLAGVTWPRGPAGRRSRQGRQS